MLYLENDILEWQEHELQNPMGFLSNDYFLHSASVLYAKGKTLTEYMAADISLLLGLLLLNVILFEMLIMHKYNQLTA